MKSKDIDDEILKSIKPDTAVFIQTAIIIHKNRIPNGM